MSDSGQTASGGLLSEGLPGVVSEDFDPLALYDQIYPDWREGPKLPVDPLTEPMPTDPSLGSMDAEATTFPKGFSDISGFSEYMPPMADFDFGMHNDALQAHDQLVKSGVFANLFAGNGQSLPQQAVSTGASGDGGISDLVVHRRFVVPDEVGPVPIPNYVPPADGSSGMQELATKIGDNSGAGDAGNSQAASGPQTTPGTNSLAGPAVPYDQMSAQERGSLQFSSPDASNQADPTTAPFAPAKPIAPLPPSTAQTTGRATSDPFSSSALNGLLTIANVPLRGGANVGTGGAQQPSLSISSPQTRTAPSGQDISADIHYVDPNNMEVVTAPDTTAKLRGVIRSGEGHADANGNGADYNSVYGTEKGKGGIDLSQMTIDQAIAYQKAHGYPDSNYTHLQYPAIGAYQFKPGTLQDAAAGLGLDTATAKMDQATQDALAVQRMQYRGLDDYQSGRISKGQFMQNLFKEWASLPTHPKDVSDAIDALQN